MYEYRRYKENAKNDLFYALLFLGNYTYSIGLNSGKAIIPTLRTKRLRWCEATVIKYIDKKWNK